MFTTPRFTTFKSIPVPLIFFPIHNQHVDCDKRPPGHPRPRELQQLLFARDEPCGGYARHFRRLVIGVFHHAQSADDLAHGDYVLSHGSNHGFHAERARMRVVNACAFDFAETDGKHLSEAALDSAETRRVFRSNMRSINLLRACRTNGLPP